MRSRSLQTRLLASVLGLMCLIWLVSAAMIWVDTRHELDELLDGHLAQAAALLVAQQSQAEGDHDDPSDSPPTHKYAPRVAFQVFHNDELTMRSSNAPMAPLSDHGRGFDTVRDPDGVEWRIFVTLGAEPDVRILVAERIGSRLDILQAMARSVLLPLGLALPALALALWWAVMRGLQPLRSLRQALEERHPQSLEPVAPTDEGPTEMQPLVDALNGLIERMAHMLESERRFTADAAHELRTPIAAIRMQAQVALGAAGDDAARDHALRYTLAGCDRATRLVEQLLTLARLEGQQAAAGASTCDAAKVVRGVVAELAPSALAKKQALELDAPQACTLAVGDTLLGVLARNLVDNALRYSPPGAQVQVAVAVTGDVITLQVDDSGPGLGEPSLQKLGERFFRVLGTAQSGSGLGWSIVRRIAQVQGASVVVQRSRTLGGLRVLVRWPGSPQIEPMAGN
jgi:two-component system sensor histidine kinase QseC